MCDTVEPIGIVPAEEDGHYIPMILHTLADERFFPCDIMYLPVDSPTVQSGRKHEYMVVAPEAGLYHPREVTALFPGLVDADAHRFQAREVQKQIIDKIAKLSVIMPADDGAERNTILSGRFSSPSTCSVMSR